MSSQFVLLIRDFRDANTVTSEIEPEMFAADSQAAIAQSEGDAWAYAATLSKYFGDIATGAIRANIEVLPATSTASDTVTSNGTNVSNGDTITIGGVLVTFVTATPVGSQVQIGIDAFATLGALKTFISGGGSSNNLAGIAIANRTGNLQLTLYSTLPGTAGNSTTLAKSAASLTLGGATFSGGAAITVQRVISAGL